MVSKIKTLICCIFLFLSLTECGGKVEELIIIVPENYTGYILIIYDQDQGINKEYRNKSQVYRIPSSGILLTKFSNNPGWSTFPEFYRGSIAQENKIPFIPELEKLSEDKVSAFGGAAGFQSRDFSGKKGIRFIQFYIGNQSQIRKYISDLDHLNIVELVDK